MSDWSSDVCSSDLLEERLAGRREVAGCGVEVAEPELMCPDRFQACRVAVLPELHSRRLPRGSELVCGDRKRLVWGEDVAGGVDLGGGRIINTQTGARKKI